MEIHRLTMEGQAWIMEVHNRPDETDKHDNIALWKEPYLQKKACRRAAYIREMCITRVCGRES